MKIRPDLSTLLDVPGMARAKRENEELRDALVRASAALERVTAELVEAYCLAAEEFAAACAAQQRVWRAASDLAREHAEKTAEDLARATEQARTPESAA